MNETYRIEDALVRSKKKNKQLYFDKLVLREFKQSLFSQDEYIQFFFTKKYNKQFGVKTFLNNVFFPESKNKLNENNGAIDFLENLLKRIRYKSLTKMENMMRDITNYSVSVNPSEYEDMLLEKIPLLRKIISDYNIDMSLETREQIEMQDKISEAKEIEKIREKIKNLFGPYRGDIPRIILASLERKAKELKRKIPLDESIRDLIYELVITDEKSSSFDTEMGIMELGKNIFYFYKDKKTGKTKFYIGELIRTVGHENYHRLQRYFSRNMPPGLTDCDGEYSISARIILEGVPTILENNFMRWLEDNRERYSISKRDINISKLSGIEEMGNRLIRLLHSIYHREEKETDTEERDAHLRLARVSGIPVYADDNYLNDEPISEIYYFAFYIFGAHYVSETLKELEKIEKNRLGKPYKKFLKRNEPIILQGLMTGNWGCISHKDFFIKHYWPKARKYCD